MAYWHDKGVKLAAAARHRKPTEWSSNDISRARKIIRDGGTSRDVWQALFPEMPYRTVLWRLGKLGIKPIHGRAHRGFETSLPDGGGAE